MDAFQAFMLAQEQGRRQQQDELMEVMKQAELAQMYAQEQGFWTPELMQAFKAPMGEQYTADYPTNLEWLGGGIEKALRAIPGLGGLFGGGQPTAMPTPATQPFQAPTDIRSAMEAVAEAQGYRTERRDRPDMPSENRMSTGKIPTRERREALEESKRKRRERIEGLFLGEYFKSLFRPEKEEKKWTKKTDPTTGQEIQVSPLGKEVATPKPKIPSEFKAYFSATKKKNPKWSDDEIVLDWFDKLDRRGLMAIYDDTTGRTVYTRKTEVAGKPKGEDPALARARKRADAYEKANQMEFAGLSYDEYIQKKTDIERRFYEAEIGKKKVGKGKAQKQYKYKGVNKSGHRIGSNDGNIWYDIKTGEKIQ